MRFFSILNLASYLDFNAETAENPALYKYDVTHGINLPKALLTTSGYSFLVSKS